MTQLSFFGAGAREPRVADLAGLLAGPGQAVVRGDAASVSVLVGDPWRADALGAVLAGLDLPAAVTASGTGSLAVRTPFDPRLRPLAEAWRRGSGKRAPAGLVLEGPALRLWCLAAGSGDPAGHLLRLGPADEAVWVPVGAALAGAGVPATFVVSRAVGPAFRVTGRRRLARLAELVGEAPPGAPSGDWPAPGHPTGRHPPLG